MVFLIIKLSDCVSQEAAVREVREETGLELKATSLLVVENPSPAWFRFTFTGKIIGTVTYNHSELFVLSFHIPSSCIIGFRCVIDFVLFHLPYKSYNDIKACTHDNVACTNKVSKLLIIIIIILMFNIL